MKTSTVHEEALCAPMQQLQLVSPSRTAPTAAPVSSETPQDDSPLLALPPGLLASRIWPHLGLWSRGMLRATCREVRCTADALLPPALVLQLDVGASAWGAASAATAPVHSMSHSLAAGCRLLKRAPHISTLHVVVEGQEQELEPRPGRPTRTHARLAEALKQLGAAAATDPAADAPPLTITSTDACPSTSAGMQLRNQSPSWSQRNGITSLSLSFSDTVHFDPALLQHLCAAFPRMHALRLRLCYLRGTSGEWAAAWQSVPAGLTSLTCDARDTVTLACVSGIAAATQLTALQHLDLGLPAPAPPLNLPAFSHLASRLSHLRLAGPPHSVPRVAGLEQLLRTCGEGLVSLALSCTRPLTRQEMAADASAARAPLHQLLPHVPHLTRLELLACGGRPHEVTPQGTPADVLSFSMTPEQGSADLAAIAALPHLSHLVVADHAWWTALVCARAACGQAVPAARTLQQQQLSLRQLQVVELHVCVLATDLASVLDALPLECQLVVGLSGSVVVPGEWEVGRRGAPGTTGQDVMAAGLAAALVRHRAALRLLPGAGSGVPLLHRVVPVSRPSRPGDTVGTWGAGGEVAAAVTSLLHGLSGVVLLEGLEGRLVAEGEMMGPAAVSGNQGGRTSHAACGRAASRAELAQGPVEGAASAPGDQAGLLIEEEGAVGVGHEGPGGGEQQHLGTHYGPDNGGSITTSARTPRQHTGLDPAAQPSLTPALLPGSWLLCALAHVRVLGLVISRRALRALCMAIAAGALPQLAQVLLLPPQHAGAQGAGAGGGVGAVTSLAHDLVQTVPALVAAAHAAQQYDGKAGARSSDPASYLTGANSASGAISAACDAPATGSSGSHLLQRLQVTLISNVKPVYPMHAVREKLQQAGLCGDCFVVACGGRF